jgi:hypothetical protein
MTPTDEQPWGRGRHWTRALGTDVQESHRLQRIPEPHSTRRTTATTTPSSTSRVFRHSGSHHQTLTGAKLITTTPRFLYRITVHAWLHTTHLCIYSTSTNDKIRKKLKRDRPSRLNRPNAQQHSAAHRLACLGPGHKPLTPTSHALFILNQPPAGVP